MVKSPAWLPRPSLQLRLETGTALAPKPAFGPSPFERIHHGGLGVTAWLIATFWEGRMHPQIVIGQDHPCDPHMVALFKCHEASPFNRFTGACNNYKTALDRCLREDKKQKVHKSVQAAREKRARWEEVCKEYGVDAPRGAQRD